MRRSAAKTAKLAEVLERLEREYGRREFRRDRSGLDTLVAIVLSQNTSWNNAKEGYRRLKRDFPSWSRVLSATVEHVQRSIGVCGLGHMRARRLQAMLQRIKGERGRLTLEFVGRMGRDEAEAYLSSFHGVGPRTVAGTLMFGFGMPLFPVDNGVLRVMRRLGVVRPIARDVEVAGVVEGHTPEAARYPLHVLTYRHAKDVCKPRNPLCRECVLLSLCPTGQRRVRHRPAKTEPPPRPPKARKRATSLSRWASAGVAHSDDE